MLAKRPGGHHDHLKYYDLPKGEHYRLLAKLASWFEDSVFVDIGTFLGLSALALSGGSNHVLTFDIEDKRLEGLFLPESVQFKQVNMIDDTQAFPLEAVLAVLDVDPHDGIKEKAVVKQLLDRKWSGLMVCDDIHLNDGMKEFWRFCQEQDDLQTYDATAEGHCTGSGICAFRQPLPTEFL